MIKAKSKTPGQTLKKQDTIPSLDDIIAAMKDKWKGKDFKLNKEDEENCDEYPLPDWWDSL